MKHKIACYYLANKNDFCLEESITGLKAQGLAQAVIICPAIYWLTWEPTPDKDMDELRDIAQRTGSWFQPVEYTDDTALAAEGGYRNFAQQYLYDRGFEHIMNADGDELFLPGFLAELDGLIDGVHGAQFDAVVSIGVPGYPVEGAGGPNLFYIPPGACYTWGRSSECPRKSGSRKVIHFSATRRTLDDVVIKSRKSAHYPDKTYDFDGWIKDVLPYARPGMADAHMYTGGERNIWPMIRHWTKEEWAFIPDSLKPYLGKPA